MTRRTKPDPKQRTLFSFLKKSTDKRKLGELGDRVLGDSAKRIKNDNVDESASSDKENLPSEACVVTLANNSVSSGDNIIKADNDLYDDEKDEYTAASPSVSHVSDIGRKTLSSQAEQIGNKDNTDASHNTEIRKDAEKNRDSNSVTDCNNDSKETKRESRIKCSECKQYLEDVSLYPGDPSDAVDEVVAITSDHLHLDMAGSDFEERASYKLTEFCVYDKNLHLCSFDGLIEKDSFIYFSGVIKNVFDEDPSPTGGILSKQCGPIIEWFIYGYESISQEPILCLGTEYATYYLMNPIETYGPFMNRVRSRLFLATAVITQLEENHDCTYEELVEFVENLTPPLGLQLFTADDLLQHAQFIVDQAENLDLDKQESPSTDVDADNMLLKATAMHDLIDLAGATLAQRRKINKQLISVKKKDQKSAMSLATTTPIVRAIFDSIFRGQIDDKSVSAPRRKRCGVCEACQRADCGGCTNCLSMLKFGGNGKSKQCCKFRVCPNMVVPADENADPEGNTERSDKAEDDQPNDRPNKEASDGIFCPVTANDTFNVGHSKVSLNIEWVGEPCFVELEKTLYSAASINGQKLVPGDCVTIVPDLSSKPDYIGRVVYMFEKAAKKKKPQAFFGSQHDSKFIHVDWFLRGNQTVLGEAADPHELFLFDACDDVPLSAYSGIVQVRHKEAPVNWSMAGGENDPDCEADAADITKSLYYQKWYQPEALRFVDLPVVTRAADNTHFSGICPCCVRLKEEQERVLPKLMAECPTAGGASTEAADFSMVKIVEEEYHLGTGVYLEPETYKFKLKKERPDEGSSTADESTDDEQVDDLLYPEKYRKTAYVKGSNDDCPDPFQIGRIKRIFCARKSHDAGVVSANDIKLTLQMFYRPKDTHRGHRHEMECDLNKLYMSQEQCTVRLSKVQGPCLVYHVDDIGMSLPDYFNGGLDRYYFDESYEAESQEFTEASPELRKRAGKGKGMGKGKGIKSIAADTLNTATPNSSKLWGLDPGPSFAPLRTLDVFAGCGGLSEGLHQADVAVTCWAIEKEEPAAHAFRLNNPNSTVFVEDCNELLHAVMEGKKIFRGNKQLPQKGEVELLCGGPPCQGFSGMNRFNTREYSKFKNSLISSYLSYCDYYRPRFFILENVRNFVSFKSSMVLKLTLRALLAMGYQCTAGVMQAGSYGVPQTRRRAIIFAAAPREKLPHYPEPLHVFASRGMQISFTVDDIRYNTHISRLGSAPFRTITVRDALSDLPHIKNGASNDKIPYSREPRTHFQRLMRGSDPNRMLHNHVCKEMSALVHMRMQKIPVKRGADWRELPNIEVTLSDGTRTKKLRYNFHDKKQGRGSQGQKRGVCPCAEKPGQTPCDPAERQENTLIPWCLPHTGNRHNHWAGLYGRLELDGFFSTTITNPEPMGKQGRVLHPSEHRVVSVRECARSQGFPDCYVFYGTVLDKHRQVGNAVPPPLAKALGLEIKKCLVWKVTQLEQPEKDDIASADDDARLAPTGLVSVNGSKNGVSDVEK